MPLANDMTLLLNKIERRLGLLPLEKHLPEYCQKDKWADVIMQDTIVTFSRYYPNGFKLLVNEETCYKKRDQQGLTWYYIKDEILQGNKLLGLRDIDWTDTTSNNASLGSTSLAGGYFYPQYGCLPSTFDMIVGLQTAADTASLYNRAVYIDFQPPNRFCVRGLGNTNYDLTKFTVILLIEHKDLSTISATMLEAFEFLATCDIANFLYQNLKYWDGLDTAYINIDLKLSELREEADKRKDIIEELKNSYITTSNPLSSYIWTV